MQILHMVSAFEKASGVSVFVGELAGQQAADGHNVTILVKSRSPLEHPISPSVRIITKDDSSALQLQLETTTKTIVHLHALWDPWLTKMAKSFRKQGAKIAWSPHGMLTPWALKNKWPKKIVGLLAYQYWSLRKTDLIHVTAYSEVEDVRRLRLKNKIVLAPLGVRLCKALDNIVKQKYVCFVSRIQRKKGLLNLLQAWAKLPSDLKLGWKIKIAGPDEDNHTAELRTLANELKITSSVEFLGPVYDEAKDKLYAEAAFSVLPTHSENFGSVVIESLAQGTPVICTKGAPWKDLVDYKCGWWIDIGVEPLVKALTAAMTTSISDLNLLGQNGRELVERKYTWPAVAKTIEAAYAKTFH